MQTYSREQMERLAENKDNIVVTETESKNPTARHKFKNEYLGMQVRTMRALFEEYTKDYTGYSEAELRTKVLNSQDGRYGSWMILAGRYKYIFDVVLKKFTNDEDKRKYDSLLIMIKGDELREKGLIKTEQELQAFFKQAGLAKDMYPVQDALEKLNTKK